MFSVRDISDPTFKVFRGKSSDFAKDGIADCGILSDDAVFNPLICKVVTSFVRMSIQRIA